MCMWFVCCACVWMCGCGWLDLSVLVDGCVVCVWADVCVGMRGVWLRVFCVCGCEGMCVGGYVVCVCGWMYVCRFG